MSTILEDYAKYTNEFYLVHPPEASHSGNGTRYTGEKVMALAHHNALDDEERTRLAAAYKACEREPGLLMRSPVNDFGYQSVDDTVAALYVSSVLGTGYAKDFLKYGREKGATSVDDKNQSGKKLLYSKIFFYLFRWVFGVSRFPYVYNNINPETFSTSSWLGRQQQLICHAQFAAGENPPGWRKLWWCLTVLWSMRARKEDWDAHVLTLYLVKEAKGKSWLCDQVRKLWIRNHRRRFPRGAAEHVWPNHPSGKWLEGVTG